MPCKTVTLQVAVNPLSVAVTTVVPGLAPAVTRPVALTVAMPGWLESQVASALTLRVSPKVKAP